MMIGIQNLATKTQVQSIKKWANIEPLYTVAILDVLNMINDLSKKNVWRKLIMHDTKNRYHSTAGFQQ